MICFFSVVFWTSCSEKMGSLVKGAREPTKRRSISVLDEEVTEPPSLMADVVWRLVGSWI